MKKEARKNKEMLINFDANSVIKEDSQFSEEEEGTQHANDTK